MSTHSQPDAPEEPQPPSPSNPPPIAKGIAFFLVGLLGIHFGVTFLFNAPDNPVKDALGDEVSGYIQPFFQQNWSLFAPNPINSEDELLVRAQVLDPDSGETTTTDWVSATRLEWQLIENNPFPSRASRLSSNLHRRLDSAWRQLSTDQQSVLAEDFSYVTDWGQITDRLAGQSGGTVTADVATMVRADRVATAYATQFATAHWGEDVQAVQYQLSRTPVPRWQERFADAPEAVPTIRDFGWRPLVVNDGQDQDAFARTVEGLLR